MSIIKLSLNVVLPGRIMLSEQECSKNPEESFNHHSMVVTDEHHNKELIHFSTRKNKPAVQCLNISEDAYKAMTAKASNQKDDMNNCPEWSKARDWYNLSKAQRLVAHLDRISKSIGGISFTYNVMED